MDYPVTVDENISIPKWIQNNARWWADDVISDDDFKSGIQYMLNEDIISFKGELQLPKIKTANKNETDISSGFALSIKISDLMHGCAWAIFAIWFLGLFFIDLYPVQDYLLGVAIGLGIGVVAIHKINKKTSRLFH